MRRAELERLAALFARADVPCVISDTIQADLWTKLSMNCAYNAASALGRAKYGRVLHHPYAVSYTHLTLPTICSV